jgi:hypothetical protein
MSPTLIELGIDLLHHASDIALFFTFVGAIMAMD